MKPELVFSESFESVSLAAQTQTRKEVIAGKASLIGDSTASQSSWNEFYQSPAGLFQVGHCYRVQFDYKVLQKEPGAYFYSLLRSAAVPKVAGDVGWKQWQARPGSKGSISLEVSVGAASDYYLIIGIHNKAAVSVDNIQVTKLGPCVAEKTFVANYDEGKVPSYRLPKLLKLQDGAAVKNKDIWASQRRQEVLQLFETNVYGKMPGRLPGTRFELRSLKKNALGGKAVRKEVRVHFAKGAKKPFMDILIYLPAQAAGPVPLFFGMNFRGNHSIHADPQITLPLIRQPEKDERASKATRGASSHRWPVEAILARGYGLATVYYADLDPDFDDGFKNGVHPLFYKQGQTQPAADEWGSIGAWAWGMSRAMDYFETDADIDAQRVAVLGHSRLGKAALWAGAQDQRFALVISNNSGSGGAALARRRFGQTLGHSAETFPFWFCQNYQKYIDKESQLPVDQHMLIALMAPRPVYVASATEDLWADPKGEFLACVHAEPAYKLYGLKGVGTPTQPLPDQPVQSGPIGYHLRSGTHDVTLKDWGWYMDFADKHFTATDKPKMP